MVVLRRSTYSISSMNTLGGSWCTPKGANGRESADDPNNDELEESQKRVRDALEFCFLFLVSGFAFCERIALVTSL